MGPSHLSRKAFVLSFEFACGLRPNSRRNGKKNTWLTRWKKKTQDYRTVTLATAAYMSLRGPCQYAHRHTHLLYSRNMTWYCIAFLQSLDGRDIISPQKPVFWHLINLGEHERRAPCCRRYNHKTECINISQLSTLYS